MKKDRPDWAKRLKAARESIGFSQRKFAQLLGINAGTLLKYEMGDREPGFNLIKRIVELTFFMDSFQLILLLPIQLQHASQLFLNSTGP